MNSRLKGIIIILTLLTNHLFSQQIYFEDFGTANCIISDSAGDFPVVGGGPTNWTITNIPLTTSDDAGDWFFVSAREEFTGVDNCRNSCTLSGGTNRTLHIGTTLPGTVDAAAIYHPDSVSNIRAVSPAQVLTTYSSVMVEFDYLEGGNAGDNASFSVSIGGSVVPVANLEKTISASCPATQAARWQHFAGFLPAGANNQPVVELVFDWENNGDGTGTQPSFAVDNIRMRAAPPIPGFTTSDTIICANGDNCVTFIDTSQGFPTGWSWDFGPNAIPSTSNLQNPTVCFTGGVGNYPVTLTVSNVNGDSSVTDDVTLIDCAAPTPGFSMSQDSICFGNCISFTDTSLAGEQGTGQWQWLFQGGTPATSTAQNPSVCYPVVGSYSVTLTVTDTAAGTQSTQVFTDIINVLNCTLPEADLAMDTNSVCNNGTINFIDASTGNPDNWLWEFEGGNPAVSTDQNPAVQYTVPGIYNITLTVSNSAGTDSDTLVDTITVVNCPMPSAQFDVNRRNICPGECVVFTDLSTNAYDWSWHLPGSSKELVNEQNAIDICYDSAGSYDVMLIARNLNFTDTLLIEDYIIVDSCLIPDASYTVERDSICRGTCVQFFNTSKRSDTIWWHFYKIQADTIDSVAFDSVFNVQDPILCLDDSMAVSVVLRTVNRYGVDVRYDIDKPVVFVGGAYPQLDAGPDKEILVNTETDIAQYELEERFEAEGTGRYFTWFPEEGLSCYDCPDPIIHAQQTTKYFVSNYDNYGCIAYDSVVVFVEESYYAGIPNAFSPNGDDTNDRLYVRGNGISVMVLRVWNRYGELVYESRNQKEGWDGTYKGVPAPAGGYKYHVELTFLNGVSDILKGSVTLFR